MIRLIAWLVNFLTEEIFHGENWISLHAFGNGSTLLHKYSSFSEFSYRWQNLSCLWGFRVINGHSRFTSTYTGPTSRAYNSNLLKATCIMPSLNNPRNKLYLSKYVEPYVKPYVDPFPKAFREIQLSPWKNILWKKVNQSTEPLYVQMLNGSLELRNCFGSML